MRPGLHIAVALLVVAALVVGCGGGDDSSNDESTSAAQEAGEDGTTQPDGAEEPGGELGQPLNPIPEGTAPDGSGGGSPGGAGGSNGSAKLQSSAKVRFVKEANAICSRRTREALTASARQVQQAEPKSSKEEGEIQAESIDSHFLPPIQKQIDEIRALEAPPGDEAEVEAFLDAMQSEVDLIEQKEYNADTVQRFGSEFKHSTELVRSYGLDSCGFASS